MGNAWTSLFKAKAALEVGLAEYRHDPTLFLMAGDRLTPLKRGTMTDERNNEKAVLDPEATYRRESLHPA